jgi:transposase
MAKGQSAAKAIKEIRRKTRRRFPAKQKIRIVIKGMRGEDGISELCRLEGIAANLYYRWSKDFLEAGKQRLAGDTKREATSAEVTDLRKELGQLKELVAEVLLEDRVPKQTAVGFDPDEEGSIAVQPLIWVGSCQGPSTAQASITPPCPTRAFHQAAGLRKLP